MTLEMLIIPLLIFVARVADVSLGTLRMILIINGMRWVPAGLGFIEVIIWVVAIGNAVANLTDPLVLIGYAGGFAAGTFLGAVIEERVGIGFRIVTIVNPHEELRVADHIREAGYAATELSGRGRGGPVEVVIAVVRRRSMAGLSTLLTEVAPRAFMTVERADRAIEGFLGPGARKTGPRWFRGIRK